MFRNAFAALGMLHIVHNMCANMRIVYPDGEVFWNRLKDLDAVLTKRYRRQRLIGTCIVDASAVGLGALAQVSKFAWTLYEKRWGCVVDFLKHLQPLLAMLRRVWSERKYASNVDGGDAEKLDVDDGDGASQLSPALLTETLRSSMFGMEVALVLRLQAVVQNLGDWAERCPCHSACLHGLSRRQAEGYMKEFIDSPGLRSCPFAGKRAPEMAAGKLLDVFDGLVAQYNGRR